MQLASKVGFEVLHSWIRLLAVPASELASAVERRPQLLRLAAVNGDVVGAVIVVLVAIHVECGSVEGERDACVGAVCEACRPAREQLIRIAAPCA